MKLRSGLLMTMAAALVASSPLAGQRPPQAPQVAVPVAVPVDQQDPQSDQPQGGLQNKQLSPLEERERQIRQFDQRTPRGPAPSQIPAVPGDADANAAGNGGPAAPGRPNQQVPLPGSVAAASRKQDSLAAVGPKVAGDADNAVDPYTGPAVLTRSYTLQTPQLTQDLHFQYTVGVNEVYDSTNTTLASPARGVGRIGQQYTWGFSGRHIWKKDVLSVNYGGAWNAYPAQNLRGSNHTLQANFSRLLARRLTLNVVMSGSILTQGYSLENPVTNPTNSLADVNIAASPSVQLFDTTTRQVNFGPSLQWQKSARLSFSMGGSWFAVERDGLGLIGQTGYQAQADVNYRITRKITTGVYYSATFYRYDHDIAVTNSQGTGALLSVSLDRATQLRFRGGLNSFENQSLTLVNIEPGLAALLGTATGVIDQYKHNYFTEISGELARDLHRNRTATLSFSRGLAPGNGLILASVQQSAAAGFNMRVFRQYAVSTGLGWTDLSSSGPSTSLAGQVVGKYSTDYLYLSFNRPLARRAQASLRFDYRKFTISNGGPNPNQLRVSLGVNWASGEGPLRFW